MTALGGIGHTLPFLVHDFRVAMGVAMSVVVVELAVISWIRHRYMDTPIWSAALQVGLGRRAGVSHRSSDRKFVEKPDRHGLPRIYTDSNLVS